MISKKERGFFEKITGADRYALGLTGPGSVLGRRIEILRLGFNWGEEVAGCGGAQRRPAGSSLEHGQSGPRGHHFRWFLALERAWVMGNMFRGSVTWFRGGWGLAMSNGDSWATARSRVQWRGRERERKSAVRSSPSREAPGVGLVGGEVVWWWIGSAAVLLGRGGGAGVAREGGRGAWSGKREERCNAGLFIGEWRGCERWHSPGMGGRCGSSRCERAARRGGAGLLTRVRERRLGREVGGGADRRARPVSGRGRSGGAGADGRLSWAAWWLGHGGEKEKGERERKDLGRAK